MEHHDEAQMQDAPHNRAQRSNSSGPLFSDIRSSAIRTVACFDPSVKENWKLPPFFDLTQRVDEETKKMCCTIHFNRNIFCQMARAKDLPAFFPIPFGLDSINDFLKKQKSCVLTTAVAFPFPNVFIKAPPLYTALVSFGCPIEYSSNNTEWDLTMDSTLFTTFKVTTWKEMIKNYVSTILVLGETPKEVPSETYRLVVDALGIKINRLLELMNDAVFKNNSEIQHYCKRVQLRISTYRRLIGNAANPFPRLESFIDEIGAPATQNIIKRFWDAIIIFMPMFARAFEVAILNLTFNRTDTTSSITYDPNLLFPSNSAVWLPDIEWFSHSSCLVDLDRWPAKQLQHFQQKIYLLNLTSTVGGLLPEQDEESETYKFWKQRLLRYLSNLDFYYHGAHFLPLWFEFIIHTIAMAERATTASDKKENVDEKEEEEEEESETDEIQMSFDKIKLFN